MKKDFLPIKSGFNFQFKKGFTFIETLVVLSVLGLIFPIMFSTLFVILELQLRIFRLTEVKRQGDYIVSFLENSLKDNAYTIYAADTTEICEAGSVNPFPHSGNVGYFQDKYNSIFSIDYNWPNLTVVPNPIFPAPTFSFPPGQLNSSKVIISSFVMTCQRESIFSAPLVSLNFSICYNLNESCTSSRPEEEVSLNYQTNIKLRTYPTQ